MSDMARPPARAPGSKAGNGVGALANRALDVVAGRNRAITSTMNSDFLTALRDAAVSAEGFRPERVVEQMLLAGVSFEDVTDVYIPEVARELGELWCEDLLGFASVTIGVARLQGLMRCIDPCLTGERAADPNAAAVAVIVAADVFHTLGAIVLVAQLRRIGLAVTPLIGVGIDEIGPALRKARYDAVLISASCGESLESLRKMVEQVKNSTGTPPPVVIGGTVLESEVGDGMEVAALTGADHVTSDLFEALSKCGLLLKPRAASTYGAKR